MHKPYYGAYIHKFGTGFVGIRFGTGKGISTWEPINDRLHEDFINNYSFMNVYGTLKKIEEKINDYTNGRMTADRMTELKIRERYLDLLLQYHLSNMSVYVNDWWPPSELHSGTLISRLDCLDGGQFFHLMHLLEIEYNSNMKVWECKLGDLDTFAWKGV